MPSALTVRLDRTTWTPPPIFDLVREVGKISQADVEATLNQGVGMVALLPPDDVDDAVRALARFGYDSWVCGAVEPKDAEDSGDPAGNVEGNAI